MYRKKILLIAGILLCVAAVSQAEHDENDLWNRETLTNGFGGLSDKLADKGIEVGLGITQIYQQNVHGATSTHRRAGRYSGSYDLELEADMQKLAGIENGSLYMHTQGRWSESEGIDGPSVGSVFGVNADAGRRRSMDISELWYEHAMLHETLRLRVGKLDITGGFECRGCPVSFDGSAFANDETAQFLNNALVNNPTIPFPDYGLAVILYYNPIESWYISGGVIDAQADGRETGFNTTFRDEDYFFYVFETGITPQFGSAKGPLQGAYRIGFWNDPQPKANSDASQNYRDDVGFYLSCDQMLVKENADEEDSQGLGTFFRYGYAPSKRNDVTNFWSFGFQYQGLVEGRDDDVLGLGYAKGIFSNSASTTYTDDYEDVIEVYYNAQITPWLNISPSIQYVGNPGGGSSASDAVVLGLRAQIAF
jgi:porin